MTERRLAARARRPGANAPEASGVYDAGQERVAYGPTGRAVNRGDHRHLTGKPGDARPGPLRELSEALFELADRLASQTD